MPWPGGDGHETHDDPLNWDSGIIILTDQQEALAFQAIIDQIKDFKYFGMTGTDRVKQYAVIRNRSPG